MNAGYLLRRGPKGGHPINNLDDLRRVALIGVVLATVIGVPSSVAFFAAYRWDLGAAVFGDPSAIIDGGPAAAAFLRWGAIGDMLFSYLLLVPLALYLHARLRPRKPWLADIGTIGALAYIFVGASGAAILAAVGASNSSKHMRRRRLPTASRSRPHLICCGTSFSLVRGRHSTRYRSESGYSASAG